MIYLGEWIEWSVVLVITWFRLQLRINQHEQTFKDKPNCGRVQFVVFETFLKANLSQSARDKSLDCYLKWYNQKYECFLFYLNLLSLLSTSAACLCLLLAYSSFSLKNSLQAFKLSITNNRGFVFFLFLVSVDSSNHYMIAVALVTFPPSFVRTVA